jgi:hypothetical protein
VFSFPVLAEERAGVSVLTWILPLSALAQKQTRFLLPGQ